MTTVLAVRVNAPCGDHDPLVHTLMTVRSMELFEKMLLLSYRIKKHMSALEIK